MPRRALVVSLLVLACVARGAVSGRDDVPDAEDCAEENEQLRNKVAMKERELMILTDKLRHTEMQLRQQSQELAVLKIQTQSLVQQAQNGTSSNSTAVAFTEEEEECRCKDRIMKESITRADMDILGQLFEECCCVTLPDPGKPIEAECGMKQCYCSKPYGRP